MLKIIPFAFSMLVIVFTALMLIKKLPQYHFFIKKGLHFFAILLCAIAVKIVPTWDLFLVVTISFAMVGVSIWKGFLADPVTGEKETGVIYFIAAFWILLTIALFTGKSEYLIFTSYSLLVLSISDGLAGAVGRWYSSVVSINKTDLILGKGMVKRKSWAGFIVFWLSSFLIILHFLGTYTTYSLMDCMLTSAIISMVLAMIEFISLRGLDNISVTVATFLFLKWLHINSFIGLFDLNTLSVFYLWLTSIILLIFFLKVRFLTRSGIFAAFILAFAVVVLSRQTLIPLFVFLIVGSLLGKLPHENIMSDDRFSKPRNSSQVFSNGGVVFLLGVIYWIGELFSLELFTSIEIGKLMLISVAICMSDTVSSELGSRYGGIPKDMISRHKLLAGVSGGITWLGSFFGFVGAVLMVVLGKCFYPISNSEIVVYSLLGFLGMMVDSFLGSVFQWKVLVDGHRIDAGADKDGIKHYGIKWVSNNAVNFLSNLLIISILCVCFWLNKF